MKRPAIYIAAGLIAVAAFAVFRNAPKPAEEIEYRYGKVEKGDLFRSTSSSGTIVPQTTVDVRSKAGGQIVRLAVEEGTVVGRGDLIALIDPRDTRTTVEQAQADLLGANARVQQARVNQQITRENSELAVRDARVRLQQAQIQLETARENARSEPITVEAALANARASLTAAEEAMRQLREVDLPQRRRDAESNLSRTEAAHDTAKREFERQTQLAELGYTSASALQQARSNEQNALSALQIAQQRVSTLDAELDSAIRTQQTRVDQARASVRQAEANLSRGTTVEQDLRRAERSVEQARIALAQAEANRLNNQVRQADVQSAQAAAVRSRVSVNNASDQLRETTVVAPRAGVITQKFLEEGTIIPPGASAFSQGTAIVQIADVSRLFVDVPVDESDIDSVKPDQAVRIIVEGFPNRAFRGTVTKIFPAATTNNAIATIRVRVEIEREEPAAPRSQGGQGGPSASGGQGRPGGSPTSRQAERGPRNSTAVTGTARPLGRPGLSIADLNPLAGVLKVGMNATCEFIELELKDVLIVPQQAIRREGEETFVLVKTADPKKPEKRVVKLGPAGNEGVQVLEGLQENEEVVIAEINLTDLRERQERIRQQQEGGGFTAGGGNQGPQRR